MKETLFQTLARAERKQKRETDWLEQFEQNSQAEVLSKQKKKDRRIAAFQLAALNDLESLQRSRFALDEDQNASARLKLEALKAENKASQQRGSAVRKKLKES